MEQVRILENLLADPVLREDLLDWYVKASQPAGDDTEPFETAVGQEMPTAVGQVKRKTNIPGLYRDAEALLVNLLLEEWASADHVPPEIEVIFGSPLENDDEDEDEQDEQGEEEEDDEDAQDDEQDEEEEDEGEYDEFDEDEFLP